MPINNPYDTDEARYPYAKILCDGTEIPGVVSFQTVNNNYYQADTFRVRFAINTSQDFNATWWGDPAKKQILLDIQASLDGGESYTSLLIGQVDHMQVSMDQGLVDVDGRDLSAYFIDNRTQETFLNKTASQVAETLADRRGLQKDITPTSTLVGRYYSDDHDRINMGQFTRTTTEWNLLCSLAQHEDFDVYVTGTVLHFKPKTPEGSDPYVVMWDKSAPWSNSLTLHLERSMNMAKDVVVQVRSWRSKDARSITKFSPSGFRIGGIQSGKEQLYSFVIPNLTEQEAQDKANKLRAQITQQERIVTFSYPADLTLQPRDMLEIRGTGSGWDQKYWVNSITRTMSFDDGFVMTVNAKNHSNQTQVLAA